MVDESGSDTTLVLKRQFDVMLQGVSGVMPKIPVRLDLVEVEAEKHMTEGHFIYVSPS